MKKYSTNEKIEIISQLAKVKKAQDLISLDVEGVSSLTDKILICSGDGTIHTRAIGKYIMEETKKMKLEMHHQEGVSHGTWILLDFGDVVMHIFDRTVREYYKLEQLWQELIGKEKSNSLP
jgi:ribosome-associated protein